MNLDVNENDLSSALCDIYDVINVLSKTIKNKPKDNEGTGFTVGDCLESVRDFLEDLERQKLINEASPQENQFLKDI